MSVMSGIESRFNSLRQELKSLEVPEWDSTLYYYSVPPAGDALKILKYVKGGDLDYEGLVVALMITARNEDGSRVFHDHQKDVLMTKAEMGVIIRVVNQMGVLTSILGGDVEKKT